MAIKKSDLYSSLWASCDELRGGMDASQYKDYVLFMLFIKYISDKYADSDDFAPPVVIPKGASFKDMIALKGKPDIGDRINTEIIQPLIDANSRLARSDFPNFNDPEKLGTGAEMVERLSNLVSIFQKPELDFSQNRAEHDDILGDAYEYLMRHFATESGKSKGQFYTPSEVSRVIAKVIGISPANTRASTTAYDPTCGSGSLLLKVAAEAGNKITLEGQEKDVTTAGLARMNMILHDFPTANILSGNTLAAPKFKDGEQLRTYDYVVANPPFSDKAWSTGLTPSADPYQRFAWGEPPAKQGDYAYLLHIIRSMKSSGKAACILPHGVLFRGNAEAVIRKQLLNSGILKGIIGLPANLFYGTGIPACILVLDKENASARKGVMMIDASKGFIKDGNKNRLREQDSHRIVDVFHKLADVPGYARMVPLSEIASEKNDYNLNLPRYIDSSEQEDIQDLSAHLNGGIPDRDLFGEGSTLAPYWQVMPTLRATLFAPLREGYSQLQQPVSEVKAAILGHAEFRAFQETVTQLFADWQARNEPRMKSLKIGDHPKAFIEALSEDLLATFKSAPLVDAYSVYQHLMDYWMEAMQDDAYAIAQDGWLAKPARIAYFRRSRAAFQTDLGQRFS
jgi:type I restriction enzyme M protein